MTELAVTLPVFLLILSALFYFKEATEFWMLSHRAARYAAWHQANSGPDRPYGTPQSAETLRQIHFAQKAEVELSMGQCSFGSVLSGSSGQGCGQPGYTGEVDTSDAEGILDMLGLNFEVHTAEVTVRWDRRFLGEQGSASSMAAVHDNYSPRRLPSIRELAGKVF